MATATHAAAGAGAGTNAAALIGRAAAGNAGVEATLRRAAGLRVVEQRPATKASKGTKTRAEAHAHRTKARTRDGWKIGTAKRADGKTGDNPCICGCKTLVRGKFAQGHDARVHSWLLAVERGERTKASLPASVQAALKQGTIKLRTKSTKVVAE